MLKKIVFMAAALFFSANSFAAVIFQDDFSSRNTSAWNTVGSNVSIDPTGGLGGSPCVKWTYNRSGTSPYEFLRYVNTHNLSEIYVRVYFRATKTSTTSGCKFIKLMGKIDSNNGYANTTFGLDQWNDKLRGVAYGYGGTQNDTAALLYFYGSLHTDVDRSATYPKTGTFINPFDGNWHCYEVHMKYSTGTNRDGEYDVWLDGTLHFSARNIINHGPNNITQFDYIRFGDYAGSPFEGEWSLWMDNIVVSDQHIGTGSISSISSPQNLSVAITQR